MDDTDSTPPAARASQDLPLAVGVELRTDRQEQIFASGGFDDVVRPLELKSGIDLQGRTRDDCRNKFEQRPAGCRIVALAALAVQSIAGEPVRNYPGLFVSKLKTGEHVAAQALVDELGEVEATRRWLRESDERRESPPMRRQETPVWRVRHLTTEEDGRDVVREKRCDDSAEAEAYAAELRAAGALDVEIIVPRGRRAA